VALADNSEASAEEVSEAMRRGGSTAKVPGLVELLTVDVVELSPHAASRTADRTTLRVPAMPADLGLLLMMNSP
jgi:hypothetical protein